MRIEKSLLRKVLEKLYEDSFPGTYVAITLCRRLFKEQSKELNLKDHSPIEAASRYLVDKGLIEETRNKDGKPQWRITALGIDKLEGGSLI